jgi:hypothetical protein
MIESRVEVRLSTLTLSYLCQMCKQETRKEMHGRFDKEAEAARQAAEVR